MVLRSPQYTTESSDARFSDITLNTSQVLDARIGFGVVVHSSQQLHDAVYGVWVCDDMLGHPAHGTNGYANFISQSVPQIGLHEKLTIIEKV